jgi:hypothetical protein
MDISAIQAEIDAALNAIQDKVRALRDTLQTHETELEILVEERERWLTRYQEAANVRSKNIWRRRLFLNAVLKREAKRAIEAVGAELNEILDELQALCVE